MYNSNDFVIDIGYVSEIKKYSISSFVYSWLIDKIDYTKLIEDDYLLFDLEEIKELIMNFRRKYPSVKFKVYLTDNHTLSDVNNGDIASHFANDINFNQDVHSIQVDRRRL